MRNLKLMELCLFTSAEDLIVVCEFRSSIVFSVNTYCLNIKQENLGLEYQKYNVVNGLDVCCAFFLLLPQVCKG